MLFVWLMSLPFSSSFGTLSHTGLLCSLNIPFSLSLGSRSLFVHLPGMLPLRISNDAFSSLWTLLRWCLFPKVSSHLLAKRTVSSTDHPCVPLFCFVCFGLVWFFKSFSETDLVFVCPSPPGKLSESRDQVYLYHLFPQSLKQCLK